MALTITNNSIAIIKDECDLVLDGCNRIRIAAYNGKETKEFLIHIDTILHYDHQDKNVIDWMEHGEGMVLVHLKYNLPEGEKDKHKRTHNWNYVYTYQEFIDARISDFYPDWIYPVLSEISSIWR